MKIGFIGLGLIGGSIARAVRYFYPDTEIIAHSRTRASVTKIFLTAPIFSCVHLYPAMPNIWSS